MARAFIGVGSNISPEQNIREALRRLAQSAKIVSISTFYQVPAMDRPGEPDFYNGVAAIDTDLPAAALKRNVLRRIEAELGRRRSSDKYAPRSIDLDLLLHDDLTLPHPDILKRAFVAIPLYEIAPDLVVPGIGVPIRDVASGFAGEELQPLREYTRRLQDALLGGL